MDDLTQAPTRLTMYLAVKAVCDGKPLVWQRSEAFEEAYGDFCRCVEKILGLQPGVGVFNMVSKGIALEMKVADTILTTDMDELIEQFEAVDEQFVDDYTVARSMEVEEKVLTFDGVKF